MKVIGDHRRQGQPASPCVSRRGDQCVARSSSPRRQAATRVASRRRPGCADRDWARAITPVRRTLPMLPRNFRWFDGCLSILRLAAIQPRRGGLGHARKIRATPRARGLRRPRQGQTGALATTSMPPLHCRANPRLRRRTSAALVRTPSPASSEGRLDAPTLQPMAQGYPRPGCLSLHENRMGGRSGWSEWGDGRLRRSGDGSPVCTGRGGNGVVLRRSAAVRPDTHCGQQGRAISSLRAVCLSRPAPSGAAPTAPQAGDRALTSAPGRLAGWRTGCCAGRRPATSSSPVAGIRPGYLKRSLWVERWIATPRATETGSQPVSASLRWCSRTRSGAHACASSRQGDQPFVANPAPGWRHGAFHLNRLRTAPLGKAYTHPATG